LINVIDLKKNYNSFKAVNGVSFKIDKGEIVGLLGPNGAGKTTIMKSITGYHYPSEGNIEIDGLNIYDDILKIKNRIGYLPENAPIYSDLTVKDYLDFVCNLRIKGQKAKKNAIDKVLEQCKIRDVYHKEIDTLSKGYKQRVSLAQAIIHDPDILILDEPTTGLDPNQIQDIRDLIKELGKDKTIILSTHIMQEVEAVCKKVLIMNKGKLVYQENLNNISISRDKEIYQISVKNKNRNEIDIERKINNLNNLDDFTIEEKRDIYNLELIFNKVDDIAIDIFYWAVENDLILLSSYLKKESLEKIFKELTNKGGHDE